LGKKGMLIFEVGPALRFYKIMYLHVPGVPKRMEEPIWAKGHATKGEKSIT